MVNIAPMNAINSITSVGQCEEGPFSKQAESPNLLETFKRKKARLQQQLADTDAVIAALEAHPDFNTLLELIAKAR